MPAKIILGITGSIAAYKSAMLCRLMIKKGYEVRVIMTPNSTAFISPLTLSTLSKHQVATSVIDADTWNNHVDLGLWADAMVIAPCTATTLGKLANGIADTMLVATYLSAKCPVYIAPAMDLDMWKHPSTLRNIQLVQSYGNAIIPVEHGELASGLVGDGRMAEPENIVKFIEDKLEKDHTLKGKTAVVTAGPTHEPIDPVRFIGNHSSGKMGLSIANVLLKKGANVHLVLGPNHLDSIDDRIHVHHVQSAQNMYETARPLIENADIAVFAAAVADFTPETVADNKIKKDPNSNKGISIALKRTIDIAGTLGKEKKPGQCFVGFALETKNEEQNAISKLERKNFDFIVLNSLNDKGAGFGVDTNVVTIIGKKEKPKKYPLLSKTKVAEHIVTDIEAFFKS